MCLGFLKSNALACDCRDHSETHAPHAPSAKMTCLTPSCPSAKPV